MEGELGEGGAEADEVAGVVAVFGVGVGEADSERDVEGNDFDESPQGG